MPEQQTFVTCAVCNRIVREQDVNTSGRCVDCAGQPARATPERVSEDDVVQVGEVKPVRKGEEKE